MEFISDSIARRKVVESANVDTSSCDIGSLTFVKTILEEYLSGGGDSLSDLLDIMTGLAWLGVCIGWSEVEAFGFAKWAGADSMLEDSATYEVDLVLWVGLSWRVGTSGKVTLQTSIGLSAILCIADSLNTTSELRTICLFLGS